MEGLQTLGNMCAYAVERAVISAMKRDTRGRIAIHEILSVDTEMKRMISEGRNEEELKAYAVHRHGMTTLKEGGR